MVSFDEEVDSDSSKLAVLIYMFVGASSFKEKCLLILRELLKIDFCLFRGPISFSKMVPLRFSFILDSSASLSALLFYSSVILLSSRSSVAFLSSSISCRVLPFDIE